MRCRHSCLNFHKRQLDPPSSTSKEYALRKSDNSRIYEPAVKMPPCLYICCHFEISDDQHGSPARPKSTSKAIQDGRRISRRHSTNRERHSPRERQRESPRADRQRYHSRHRSHSSSVCILQSTDIYTFVLMYPSRETIIVISNPILPPTLLHRKPQHKNFKTNLQQTKSSLSANVSKRKILATPSTSPTSKTKSPQNMLGTPPALKGFALV